MCFLRTILILAAVSDISLMYAAETDTQSLGKLRSSAELAFSKGDSELALQLWEKVIAMEPGNDSNYYKRFRVYLRKQKLKEAFADLSTAIKLNPANENAVAQRARLGIRLGRCAEANQDYTQLKKYVPKYFILDIMFDCF